MPVSVCSYFLMVGGDGMKCPAGSYRFMYHFGVSISYILIFQLVLHPPFKYTHPSGPASWYSWTRKGYIGVNPGGAKITHMSYIYITQTIYIIFTSVLIAYIDICTLQFGIWTRNINTKNAGVYFALTSV